MITSRARALALRAGRAFENELRTGLRVLLVVVVVAGGWTALMPLAGAVVVPGNLVVQSNVKTIQHPTGGVVAEIPVHNGKRVATRRSPAAARRDPGAGQPSDGEQAARRSAGADRPAGRRARRPAAASRCRPKWRRDWTTAPSRRCWRRRQSLFKARANARESQKDLLQSRVSQLGEEIAGLDAQVAVQGQATGADRRANSPASRTSTTSGSCR